MFRWVLRRNSGRSPAGAEVVSGIETALRSKSDTGMGSSHLPHDTAPVAGRLARGRPTRASVAAASADSSAPAASNAAFIAPEDDLTVISDRAGASPSSSRNRPMSAVDLGTALAGERLDHFELLEYIGGGGMGAVFRAHDTLLDREVALKVLSRDQGRRRGHAAPLSERGPVGRPARSREHRPRLLRGRGPGTALHRLRVHSTA